MIFIESSRTIRHSNMVCIPYSYILMVGSWVTSDLNMATSSAHGDLQLRLDSLSFDLGAPSWKAGAPLSCPDPRQNGRPGASCPGAWWYSMAVSWPGPIVSGISSLFDVVWHGIAWHCWLVWCALLPSACSLSDFNLICFWHVVVQGYWALTVWASLC